MKKNVIVTGDSRGLGSIITKTLLENGYFVVGISRKSNEVTNTFENKYKNYIHLNYDLNNSEGIKRFYLDKIKKNGSVFGLVNNAGIAYDDMTTNAKLPEINKMFNVNVFSNIMLTKYVLRDMLLNNTSGSIVHVTSVCAHTGYKGLSMYAASKGAIEAFSKTVAREFGSKKIRSNCVAPGFLETDMSENLSSSQKDRIYKRTSLKEPTDLKSVAEMILFLLSDKSKSITGQILHVDNGTI